MINDYLKLRDKLFIEGNGNEQRELELTEQMVDIWNKLSDVDRTHIESLPQPFSLDDPRTYLDRMPQTFDENDPMFIQQPTIQRED